MTVIAGIAENNHVYVGGDSAGSIGGLVFLLADGKVFKKGEFVIGCAGSHRFANIVRSIFVPPTVEANADLDTYMATQFVPALREALTGASHIFLEDGFASGNSIMLVGLRGTLFMVDGLFAIARSPDGLFAIGSGADVAIGALDATGDMPPEERINRALAAAERRTDGVRGPFNIESV